MDELTTVFEITAGANGIREDAVSRLVIGVIVLIAGITGLVLRHRTQGRFPRGLYGPTVMVAFGVLWLYMHLPLWRTSTSDIEYLVDVYRSGRCEILEGFVHVRHEQPATGHAPGDKIIVGGHEFEVNYFRVTPGYKRTISRGGALREGVFARLHHCHGVILKVEVADKEAGRQSRTGGSRG